MTSPGEHLQGKCSGMEFLCYIQVQPLLQMTRSLLCSWSICHSASLSMVPADFFTYEFKCIRSLKQKWKKHACIHLMNYLRSTRREWTIQLVDYDRVGHVVHDDVRECHVGGCTATWRVSPSFDPNTICGTWNGAVSDHKPTNISFIRIFSQTSHTKIITSYIS